MFRISLFALTIHYAQVEEPKLPLTQWIELMDCDDRVSCIIDRLGLVIELIINFHYKVSYFG